MASKMRIVNLERNMPTVAQAQVQLDTELAKAKRDGMSALKLIHGYGSSGVGGKIKEAVEKSLAAKRNARKVRVFVSGENWSIFDPGSREILDRCPELKRDSDLENCNRGITIVLL